MKMLAVDVTADIMVDGAKAIEEESDLTLADTAIAANIKMLEGLLKASPRNETLRILCSKSYGGYAFAFMEDAYEEFQKRDSKKAKEYKERANLFYERGKSYALSILEENKKFKQALGSHFEAYEAQVNDLDRSDIAPIFWTAYNWGNWINLNLHSPQAIADAPRMELLMQKVLAWDESYFFAGPHLFYGAYYGSRPPMLGGNLLKSKEHFERALTLTNRKFLIAQVLYAQYYAVQAQDKKLFDALILEVLEAPDTIFPEQSLITQLAKKKAYRLRAQRFQLF